MDQTPTFMLKKYNCCNFKHVVNFIDNEEEIGKYFSLLGKKTTWLGLVKHHGMGWIRMVFMLGLWNDRRI